MEHNGWQQSVQNQDWLWSHTCTGFKILVCILSINNLWHLKALIWAFNKTLVTMDGDLKTFVLWYKIACIYVKSYISCTDLDLTYISCLFLRILGLGDNEVTLPDEGADELGTDEGVADNIFWTLNILDEFECDELLGTVVFSLLVSELANGTPWK